MQYWKHWVIAFSITLFTALAFIQIDLMLNPWIKDWVSCLQKFNFYLSDHLLTSFYFDLVGHRILWLAIPSTIATLFTLFFVAKDKIFRPTI